MRKNRRKKFIVSSITDMKDSNFQIRQLRKAINLCIRNRLFVPALVLIASGIDAMGD